MKIEDENIEVEIDETTMQIKNGLGEANEIEPEIKELLSKVLEEKQHAPIEEDCITSVSQLHPTSSMLSKLTGRSYISMLHKQLDHEKEARQHLEEELIQLKVMSGNIASQLEQIQIIQ